VILVTSRTGSSKCSAEIAKHLARLSSKITKANKLAMYVFGLLARDEYHLAFPSQRRPGCTFAD
jgi:hypothetical protein